MNLNEPQPDPRHNQNAPVWELVIEDMRQRDQEGRRKYGTPLQTGNGRNALVDAYQEILDLAVYLRQEIEEKKAAEMDRDMANGCIAMIGDFLRAVGCRCGPDAHEKTPPMMYPEWIGCVISSQVEKRLKELQTPKE